MEITNLVRPAAAEVITITKLQPGNVYSRLQKESYGDRYFLTIGVVQTVHHNGIDAAFTALEVNQLTNAVEVKAYGTESNLVLFAATPDEAAAVIGSARDAAYRTLNDAARALDNAKRLCEMVDNIIERVDELTAPEQKSLAAF